MSKEIDWSVFKRRVAIQSDVNTIFEHWISQNGIEKWFLSRARFYDQTGQLKDANAIIQKGDSYKWEWHGSDELGEGIILDYIPSEKVNFTFLGCEVLVRVVNEAGENVLEIQQSSIATDEASKLHYYVGCTRGWTFYMANLKSILEGGIDLRNRNKAIKQVINS